MEELSTAASESVQGPVEVRENFSEVKRKRQRAKEASMDTSEGVLDEDTVSSSKRPSFPPVNVSTAMVGSIRTGLAFVSVHLTSETTHTTK